MPRYISTNSTLSTEFAEHARHLVETDSFDMDLWQFLLGYNQ